jgi:2-polyprenyl-6-methoxyphenol hydroxylase-like FAD-dependent oxidoreductase
MGAHSSDEVAIVGAGIGGLTLALSLHQAGIACRVFEAATELKPLGVGINLLPHAMREMDELGLADALAAKAVVTRESAFFNRFGQLIYREPAGRFAGYDWPQLSIHRGDLHAVLLAAVRERLGVDAVATDHRCTGIDQDGQGVTLRFTDDRGKTRDPVRAALAVGCDGLHSAVRRQLHPDEGAPRYSGINMWRGVTKWRPFLTGATMVRAGWFTPGKMVIYPIRDRIDAEGRQLVNWVAEIETPTHLLRRDWNKAGRLEDFLPAYAAWKFDWLDVPAMIEASEIVLEFPMVDQDPLPWWTSGRITLLGDAAHPMVPRGSNGAVQSIIDARFLAGVLKRAGAGEDALREYERARREATTRIVLMNRSNPPDAILREVQQRSGDRPFADIDDVIAAAELKAITDRYKQVSGADVASLRTRPSYV